MKKIAIMVLVVMMLMASMIGMIVGVVEATPDSNNDFEDAVEVFNGDFVEESLDVADDTSDYYKIYLDAGEELRADLYVPTDQDFDLYLYDSSYNQINSSEIDNTGTGNYVETLSWATNTAGWYYLNVSAYSGSGTYYLGITATAEWTFMVYLDADNDLENAGIGDFLEMSQIGSTSDVNIVVQFDRWDGYIWNGASWDYDAGSDDRSYGNWTDAKRFWVKQGMTPTPENASMNLGEVNMSDPLSVVDFANWSIQNFPAHKYAFIFWDHGSGWPGLCSDNDARGDNLNMSELDAALYTIQIDNDGLYLDIIGFDTCLMGAVETAYQIMDYGDYMVASEKTEPGLGWNYRLTLEQLVNDSNMSPEAFSSQMVDDFVDSYEYGIDGYYQDDVTLSAVNLTRLGDVVDAADNLAAQLIDNMTEYVNYINKTRGYAEAYDGPFSGNDAADLFHLAQNMYENVPDATIQLYSQELMQSINNSIVAERHWNTSGGLSVENAHGLTIYFPVDYSEYDTEYETLQNFWFVEDTNWDEFLNAFYTQLSNGNTAPTIDSVSPSSDPTINEGESQTFEITASDSDGNALTYQWYLDGDIVSYNATYTFVSNYSSAGTYTVDVYVLDGELADSYSWELTVNDVDTEPPSVSITAPNSNSILSSSNVTVEWTGSDNVGIDHYEVRIDGGSWIDVGKNNSHTFSKVSDGSHTVDVKAVDGAGNEAMDNVSFSVSTDNGGGENPPDEGDKPEDGGNTNPSSPAGKGISSMLWLLILLIVVVLVVALMMKKKKGKDEPETAEEPEPAEPEEEPAEESSEDL